MIPWCGRLPLDEASLRRESCRSRDRPLSLEEAICSHHFIVVCALPVRWPVNSGGVAFLTPRNAKSGLLVNPIRAFGVRASPHNIFLSDALYSRGLPATVDLALQDITCACTGQWGLGQGGLGELRLNSNNIPSSLTNPTPCSLYM